MRTHRISTLGQVLIPAAVRRRMAHSAIDGGDEPVSLEEAIELAWGAFKDSSGPSTDEMTRMNREEEREIEERKYGPDPN
ncbi:MAG: hypothetical protein WBL45_00040 [Solirubrobacterales bacterium]